MARCPHGLPWFRPCNRCELDDEQHQENIRLFNNGVALIKAAIDAMKADAEP